MKLSNFLMLFGACFMAFGILLQNCAALPDIDPSDRQQQACAALCGALDAAKCWDDPGVEDLLGSAVGLVGCVQRCISDDTINTAIDVECLAESDRCDLAKCVEVR